LSLAEWLNSMRTTQLTAIFLLLLVVGPALLPPVRAQSPSEGKPLILPFREPPGPDTWLLGQTYGNTIGAYRWRFTMYGASQGIHFGIDFSAPCGTEVVAVADGTVLGVDNLTYGSGPHNLIIDHPELGYTSLYGHLLERPDLQQWQEVKAGEVVGLTGDPAETCFGRPHLHLEIRDMQQRTRKVNPIPLIDADWDNLALVGSFSQGFERDLSDPRKWQHLADQPDSVSGGPILNDFAEPWPPAWSMR
jgi:murein DD-endopeptidase MepM/ murein hydrolase activator NlpD